MWFSNGTVSHICLVSVLDDSTKLHQSEPLPKCCQGEDVENHCRTHHHKVKAAIERNRIRGTSHDRAS
jgi:hypothetical protein